MIVLQGSVTNELTSSSPLNSVNIKHVHVLILLWIVILLMEVHIIGVVTGNDHSLYELYLGYTGSVGGINDGIHAPSVFFRVLGLDFLVRIEK